MEILRIGVLTVSDRASRGEYEDRGGPAAVDYFQRVFTSPVECVGRVVSDERPLIESALRDLSQAECRLIVTTGGTGPADRDVTPEATQAVCEKLLPGFGEQMRRVSLETVPTAILSRQTAGVMAGPRGGSLVINLPGQPTAIAECLDAVMAAVPHALAILGVPRPETDDTRVAAYRPPHA